MNKAAITKLKKFAQEHNFIKAVYLFGSMVKGTARANSDVDIAIISSKQISGWERIELENEASNQIGLDVDLSVFHQASPMLQHQILKYGKLVYETDTRERILQETAGRYAYLDSKFLYKKFGDLIDG